MVGGDTTVGGKDGGVVDGALPTQQYLEGGVSVCMSGEHVLGEHIFTYSSSSMLPTITSTLPSGMVPGGIQGGCGNQMDTSGACDFGIDFSGDGLPFDGPHPLTYTPTSPMPSPSPAPVHPDPKDIPLDSDTEPGLEASSPNGAGGDRVEGSNSTPLQHLTQPSFQQVLGENCDPLKDICFVRKLREILAE